MKSSEIQERKHYGNCPKKRESREETIIDAWRNKTGLERLPDDAQYWTICGKCSYEENVGELEPNCEPDQIIKSGLALPSQIHGIELEEKIYRCNVTVKNGINWHLGDFYETIVEYANDNSFNPAIVNADMLLMPDNAARYLAKIMRFLSHNDSEVMLVSNMVEEVRHLRSTVDDFIGSLEKEPNFQYAIDMANWEFVPNYYWYNGTGKTTTKMMTVILFKQ